MTLESLAPDQRAVLELILKQDRSYSDLADLLGISDDAVRRRAHAGVLMLGTDNGLGAEERGRVTDHLLGQLDDDERAATVALLSSSPSARAWAQDVAEKLRPVARRELPSAEPSSSAESSRRGGAVLIGVCAVVVASLVVWLLSRGDSGSSQAGAARSATSTPTPQALAEIPLRAVGNSRAKGLLQVNVTQAGQVGIVVVAQDVKPSGQDEAYAVWLTDARRKSLRIGFEGKDSGGEGLPDGTLALSGPSPDIDRARFTRALAQYDRLVVSLETSDKGAQPASVVLRGSLRRLQGGG